MSGCEEKALRTRRVLTCGPASLLALPGGHGAGLRTRLCSPAEVRALRPGGRVGGWELRSSAGGVQVDFITRLQSCAELGGRPVVWARPAAGQADRPCDVTSPRRARALRRGSVTDRRPWPRAAPPGFPGALAACRFQGSPRCSEPRKCLHSWPAGPVYVVKQLVLGRSERGPDPETRPLWRARFLQEGWQRGLGRPGPRHPAPCTQQGWWVDPHLDSHRLPV